MKKTIAAVISFLCLAVTVISTAGCFNAKTIIRITDMERFADMRDTADSIDVKFDNHTGKPFKFTVEEENEIAEIMNIVLTEELMNIGKGLPPAGDNTYITIHQGGKSYGLSVRINSEKANYYSFATDKLQSKIINLATARGAYDVTVGLIYKVINSSEIESGQTFAGSDYNKAALIDLVTGNRIAGYRFVCLLETESETDAYYNLTLSGINSYTYADRIEMPEGKLLVLYKIYQKHNLNSYYVVDALLSATDMQTDCIEFILGLYRPYTVKITVA